MTNAIPRILFLIALVLSFGPSVFEDRPAVVEDVEPCITQDSKAWVEKVHNKTLVGNSRDDLTLCVLQVHLDSDEASRRLDDEECSCTGAIHLNDYGAIASKTYGGCDDQSAKLLDEALTVAGPFPFLEDPICLSSSVLVIFPEKGSHYSFGLQIDSPRQ